MKMHRSFWISFPKKSNDIAKTKLRILESDPFPGKGGDKELFRSSKHEDVYRLHISRSYTAFYRVSQDEKIVRILWLGTIEQAHKKYVRFEKK
jgi:mRNA interferase RelE/StbE